MAKSKSHTEADPIAKEIMRRNASLKSKRSTWDTLWQDISSYTMPRKSQITDKKTEGVEGFTDEIYDTTAQRANTMLAAGQMSYCTPSQDRWFRYDAPDFIKEAGGHAAKAWFDKCSEIAMRELARSNFYVEVHEFYLDRGAFGTALLYVEEGKRTALNFTTLDVGTFSCAEDDEGLVDTVFCEKTMTARQMEQKFGIENLGECVRKKVDSEMPEDLDCEYTVIHAIFPRQDLREGDEPGADKRDPAKMDGPNKPIASIYVCVEDQNVLRNAGYDEMPALVSRFLKWDKEPYGFSPSIEALPTVKQVNFIEKAMDALAETAAFPRLLVPESMDGEVDLRAAGVTVFDPNNPNAMPKEWATQGRYDIGKDRVEVKRQMIREAFHNDLFRMFADLDKQITAYEAMQRAAEKLVQFSPTFSRMETEVFNFLLQRMFGILFRAGVFPEPPREVYVPTAAGFALAMPEVVYTSRIALAIRALQNRAFLEFVGIIQPILAIDPSVMDNFDLDKAAKGIAENVALPMAWQRSEEDVAALRKQRAEKQAQMEQVAMVQGMAKAGKDAAAAAPEIRKTNAA